VTDEERAFVIEVLGLREAKRESLDERLTLGEDHRELHELACKYAYYSDLQDWPGLLSIYTDDVSRSLSGTVQETVAGLGALEAMLVERTAAGGGGATGLVGAGIRRRHHVDTVVSKVSDDGTSAKAVAMGTVVASRETGAYAAAAHEDIYLFTFRKDQGEWRIAEQVAITDNRRNLVLHPDE
jgi:hypothetical protein